MSSQQEQIEMVASPPQHTSPCATPIETASANIRHTSPCGTKNIYRGSIIEQPQNYLAIVNVHVSPRETIHETASATIDRTVPCETMTNNTSASVHKNSVSSQRERIELVAQPPQHISPCARQLQDASALSILSHTSPCATPNRFR